MDTASIIDIAVSALTLLGTIASGIGAVWLFFRKRLARWWLPYRTGIDAMAEIPGIRESVDAARKEVSEVRISLGMLGLQVRARGDINTEAAEFECGADGSNTSVSQTYARWIGVGKFELLGWGWVNYVHVEDRTRVRAEWNQCRLEHRVFNMRYRVISADGDVIDVDTMITPIPDAPPAQQWLGVMRKVHL